MARMLIGRSPVCGLRLDDPHISAEHATLTWTGGYWEIKDLGSRNGTFVDGVRLNPGTNVKCGAGSRVAFGDPEQPWEMADDEAPGAMVIREDTGEIREAEADLLVLPSDENPEVSIYRNGTGQWVKETTDGQVAPIRDLANVMTSEATFRVELPPANEDRSLLELRLAVETLGLRFAVPRNEQQVEITLLHHRREIPLEPREHAYVLLTLARARLEDEGLPADQRGWRDRELLERKLAVDSQALNVAIHRARHQLSQAGVHNAAQIVEVKRRKRRLGTDRVQIVSQPS